MFQHTADQYGYETTVVALSGFSNSVIYIRDFIDYKELFQFNLNGEKFQFQEQSSPVLFQFQKLKFSSFKLCRKKFYVDKMKLRWRIKNFLLTGPVPVLINYSQFMEINCVLFVEQENLFPNRNLVGWNFLVPITHENKKVWSARSLTLTLSHSHTHTLSNLTLIVIGQSNRIAQSC